MSFLIPLQSYPQLEGYVVHEEGTICQEREGELLELTYELRLNAQCTTGLEAFVGASAESDSSSRISVSARAKQSHHADGVREPHLIQRSLFCFGSDSSKPCVVVLDVQAIDGLNKRMLVLITHQGTAIRFCADKLSSFVEQSNAMVMAYLSNPEGLFEIPETSEQKVLTKMSQYPMMDGAKIVDSGLLGRYRYEIHTDGHSSNPNYCHLLYLFAPREERPSAVVAAEQSSYHRAVKNKGSNVQILLSLLTAESAVHVGYDLKLSKVSYFTERALAVIKEHLKLDEAPPILTEHPSLFNSELLEAGYLGHYRFEIHGSCQGATGLCDPNYIWVCYYYEYDTEEPLLSIAL